VVAVAGNEDCNWPLVSRLGLIPARYARPMCGRARLSSDVSEIKLVFSIPPERPTPNIAPSSIVAPDRPAPHCPL
jgi:hypothetical protein